MRGRSGRKERQDHTLRRSIVFCGGGHGDLGGFHVRASSSIWSTALLTVGLVFTESGKTFDPEQVYGDAPNPTQL